MIQLFSAQGSRPYKTLILEIREAHICLGPMPENNFQTEAGNFSPSGTQKVAGVAGLCRAGCQSGERKQGEQSGLCMCGTRLCWNAES